MGDGSSCQEVLLDVGLGRMLRLRTFRVPVENAVFVHRTMTLNKLGKHMAALQRSAVIQRISAFAHAPVIAVAAKTTAYNLAFRFPVRYRNASEPYCAQASIEASAKQSMEMQRKMPAVFPKPP